MLKKKLTKESIGSRLRKTSSALFLLLSLLPSCYRVPQDLEPRLSPLGVERHLSTLPSPFSPLSSSEKGAEWGRELFLGVEFAKRLDLYRAVTSFRRSEFLAEGAPADRLLQLQYDILLCYYLGGKYREVIDAFELSRLSTVPPEFPPFRDLLLILFDSYQKGEEWEKGAHILSLIHQYYPDSYQSIALSSAFLRADLPCLHSFAELPEAPPYVSAFLSAYEGEIKSPTTASLLNALIPGSGYLYLGQVQTGITSLLINGLFIAATVHFFAHGPIAAGVIAASFEAGWYFGGIYGGASQARLYNERVYERLATPTMNREKLFPVLKLSYTF